MASTSTTGIPTRSDIEQTFQQFKQLLQASLRPLPAETGDGSTVEKAKVTGLVKDVESSKPKDALTLLEVLKESVTGAPDNDREYLMERVIQLTSELPDTSKNRLEITGLFLHQLWDRLEHPPISYLGSDFVYRTADGSNNNIMYPKLGAANTPYARSVRPDTIRPAALPDPGLIFDSVMARKKFTPHPNNLSSMLFYLASIIIHDLFHTSHENSAISETSSYLDLSPLYGNIEEEQQKMRTFKDGKIKPDCFAEKRLLGFPPGVSCMLIMFNRFHNYVVEQLALINESGRFTKPQKNVSDVFKSKTAWTKYDNDLFQTGRLVTCGLYINIILIDYVRTIINLNRTTSKWNLDPRAEDGITVFDPEGTPRGIGNQVSAEFNLIYRWHACISDRDDKWTQGFYRDLFDGKDPGQVSLPELLKKLEEMTRKIPDDPLKREVAGLTRQADNTFKDDDLVKILTESIEDTAGAFGANGVPPILRAVEILGIEQARSWNVASLNEFRQFFGLRPHETFEDINPDPYVADQLRHLYDHPDYVELYPGVVVEDAKKTMIPGSGLATNFSISRAILSDAVTLARSDRFYTVDYNPRNLTNWGFNEVLSDTGVEEGCVIYKLFLRAFPNHFRPDSVYAHYPFTIPSENKKILTDLGRAEQYTYDRPSYVPPPLNITSYSTAKAILEDQTRFHVTWGEGLEAQIGPIGGEFMLAGDAPVNATSRHLMSDALYRTDWRKEVKEFYENITTKLLKEKSHKIAGVNQVDIVRDVGNIAQAHFSANIFSLPLKTEENPFGIYTEQELYLVLTVMFVRVFFDLDPAKSFPLTQLARSLSQQLGKLVEMNVEAVNATGWIAGVIDRLHQHHTALTDYGVHMIRKLLDSGMSTHKVAWAQIIPTAAAMVANQGQVFAQIVDFYLSDAGNVHWPEICRLSRLDTAEADEQILHYAMEGIRLAGAFGSYREVMSPITVVDNGKTYKMKKGDRILLSFVDSAKDPKAFPDPEKVRLDRDIDSYLHYGAGPHQCLGKWISQVAITAMLKSVGKLDNVRRAPGPQGQLKAIPIAGGFVIYMREDWTDYFPLPTTMKVHWG
ncbi:MAG: hypothetical protein M1838_004543 [Thelocarpon superellum]|nr:MAG: hypothetical protein M1838_004543 [Thelocarpon superellum]